VQYTRRPLTGLTKPKGVTVLAPPLDIACNALPCSFTRLGLPPLNRKLSSKTAALTVHFYAGGPSGPYSSADLDRVITWPLCRIEEIDAKPHAAHKTNEVGRCLATISGAGPIIALTMAVENRPVNFQVPPESRRQGWRQPASASCFSP
jgi:hypothetical protein